MPKFLLHGRYNPAMVEALHANGAASRVAAISTGIGTVGGTVESIYWHSGGIESQVIADLPDDAAANSLMLSLHRHATDGSWATVTRLFDAAEIDVALARNGDMRPPGA